jgi:4-alpha-glucanotransferase
MRFPRSSGILLHPTSLPGPYGCGDLGDVSRHFIEWLVVAGQRVWQILPLEPTGYGNSPYMALSAFAGNPLLIGFEGLLAKGWLNQNDLLPVPAFEPRRVDYTKVIPYRMLALHTAADRFFGQHRGSDEADFQSFCEEHASWLEDFTLFKAIEDHYAGVEWTKWDADLAQRKTKSLEAARKELAGEIQFWKFTQWQFYRQWADVKKYANDRGIRIIGDIPIFVAHHSADVWSHPELFFLDKHGKPTVVAGVPPDYFSETGQRWGNPLYRWARMEEDKFQWWVERFRRTFLLVDIARIDHFRGFVGYWEIPATEKTAVRGRWVAGPKEKLFKAVQRKHGNLSIIAEDLGVITPHVIELRNQFEFPGMKVLQFAFAGGPDNPFLPHHYEQNSVVYTGTHDNDTTKGWYESATEREKAFVKKYCGGNGHEVSCDLMRLASRSVADMAIFPFQDVLNLGTEGRMNFPGKALGNWDWRFSWDQVGPEHALRMYEMSALYGRVAPDRLNLPEYPQNRRRP